MRIVLLQFYSHKPTPAYREIASALRDLGHTVWVGTPDEAGDLVWCEGEHVVAVQRSPTSVTGRLSRQRFVAAVLRRLVYLSFILRVRRFLRETRPDIVQVNPACVFWLSLLPLFMPGEMRFVLDFRQVGQQGATDLAGRLKGWLASVRRQILSRFIYHHACFLHPLGARVTLGKRWSRWGSVVPMGVDAHFLTLDRADSNDQEDEHPVRFLYVGGLSRVRRLEQILFAARQMLAVTDDFRIAFIGPDYAQRWYHDSVAELQLESVVTIEAPVSYEDVPTVASAYDVALACVPDRPAHWKYHPTLKVLEYRAMGMPIVATDCEPNREVVEDGVNGLLVQNSTESIAQAMLRFVVDRDFLRHCAGKARMMRRGITWDVVAEMYEQKVYRALKDGSNER